VYFGKNEIGVEWHLLKVQLAVNCPMLPKVASVEQRDVRNE